MCSGQSGAPCPSFSSFSQIILWLQKIHQELSCIQDQDLVRTGYYCFRERRVSSQPPCEVTAPIATNFQKHTFHHTHFKHLAPAQTSRALEGNRRADFLGYHSANLHLWKNDGRDNTWKIVLWESCSPSHLCCQPGLFCSPSASRCGVNHDSSLMKQQAVNTFPCVV